MYLVVFKAEVAQLDDEYERRAQVLRERAEQLGCLGFESYVEGSTELALSYWPDEASIKAWKSDGLHLEAQALGRDRYYEGYEVQVFELVRRYQSGVSSRGEVT